jgi:hypothetical protein
MDFLHGNRNTHPHFIEYALREIRGELPLRLGHLIEFRKPHRTARRLADYRHRMPTWAWTFPLAAKKDTMIDLNIRQWRGWIAAVQVGTLLGVPCVAAAEDPIPYETAIRPLIEKYCVDCHDADVTKGDLNLDRFMTQAQAVDSLALWQRAGMRIENKEMPPKKKKDQPTDEERALIVKWIASLQVNETDCNQIANEESTAWYQGDVMSRRLNRMEYENTLRDLLGVDLQVADLFPADGAGGEGFDNEGSALFLSAIQMEKYLAAADLAIETALPGRSSAARRAGRRAAPRTGDQSASDRYSALLAEPPKRGEVVREVARGVLDAFVRRAWRKPPDEESLSRLLDTVDAAMAKGERYEDAVKLAMKGALVSPNFLFLAEPQPPEQGNYPLGDYELASRLSYFLWSSMPDEELFELAGAEKLQDPNVLQAQVKRMLQDPKAEALGRLFGGQWLGITQLAETTKPDPDRFPEFSPALKDAMQAEAYTYFNALVREDRSLLELIDSDYQYINEDLARLYGIEGVEGPQFQRIQVADASRGGVLGMAAVLTQTSHSLRTSPVLRGKWVMEQIMGAHVPPPPPNVPSLPEDDRNTDGLTFREQLEVHRENPECAGCHSKMDPLGFGLENYDPIGRWRDTQADQPIDASGVLPSGETFNGPAELKAVLMAQKDGFAQNLTRKMLGYALGRSLNRYDNCVITDCMEALKTNEYRPSALITEIVLSYPFRHRYSAGQT